MLNGFTLLFSNLHCLVSCSWAESCLDPDKSNAMYKISCCGRFQTKIVFGNKFASAVTGYIIVQLLFDVLFSSCFNLLRLLLL